MRCAFTIIVAPTAREKMKEGSDAAMITNALIGAALWACIGAGL